MRRMMAVMFALVPLVAVLGLSGGPAAAASFNFSYVFGPGGPTPGTTVEGMLDGDISPTDPNLVENVVVTMVVVDGIAPFVPTSTSPDHNTVSFDGSHMDLEVEGLFNGLFAVLLFNLDGEAGLVTQFGIAFDSVFEPSRWELTPKVPTVPTMPGAMLFVLGGLIVASRPRWPQR